MKAATVKGGTSLKIIIRVIAIILIFTAVGFFLNIKEGNEDVLINQDRTTSDTVQTIEEASSENKNEAVQTEGVFNLIGKTVEELEAEFGKPSRVDLTAYDYKWWIYNLNAEKYVQVGVKAGKVVTIFAIGNDVNIKPFYIGEPVSEIYANYFIESIVSLDYKGSSYYYELSEEDINSRPLIRLGNIFVQLYIDKFSGKLSSVRLMDVPTLIQLHPFELANKELQAAQRKKDVDQEKLDIGNAKQLFELVNIVRMRYNLKPLLWDNRAADIAYKNSVNMYEMDEGSLQPNDLEELSIRLKAFELNVQMAEEIAAADYLDAPAIVEGWLNSKSKREKLLDKNFSHTGIGVYNEYYTQSLLQIPK